MRSMRNALLAIAVAAAWLSATAAIADGNSIKALEKRIVDLEKASNKQSCQFDKKKSIGIQCENWNGYVFGRIHYDFMLFNQDNENGLDVASGSGLRRARIGVAGELYKSWGYKFEYDEASSLPIKDAYISYSGLKSVTIKVGNAKLPFRLEEMTSSRHTLFMERALTDKNPAVPSRVLGVFASYDGDTLSAHIGVHTGKYKSKAEDFGLAGRVTFAPLYVKDSYYTHLGFSASYIRHDREGREGDWSPRLRDNSPFSSIRDTYSYDTGNIEAANWKSLLVWNPEIALGWGPFGLQGEYAMIRLDRTKFTGTNTTDLDFTNWYVQGNWWITGEHNNYNPKKGIFGRVKPMRNLSDGGLGAIGIAARWQGSNFNDYDANPEVLGGANHALSLNATFKPNPYVKLMAEYVKVFRSASSCSSCSAGTRDSPSAFQMRLSIDF